MKLMIMRTSRIAMTPSQAPTSLIWRNSNKTAEGEYSHTATLNHLPHLVTKILISSMKISNGPIAPPEKPPAQIAGRIWKKSWHLPVKRVRWECLALSFPVELTSHLQLCGYVRSHYLSRMLLMSKQ